MRLASSAGRPERTEPKRSHSCSSAAFASVSCASFVHSSANSSQPSLMGPTVTKAIWRHIAACVRYCSAKKANVATSDKRNLITKFLRLRMVHEVIGATFTIRVSFDRRRMGTLFDGVEFALTLDIFLTWGKTVEHLCQSRLNASSWSPTMVGKHR